MYFFKTFLLEKMSSELVAASEEKRKKRATDIQISYKGLNHRVKGKRIKTINFWSVDPNGSEKTRNVSIRIPDYRYVSRIKKMKTVEKLEMAVKAGDIQVYCDCPDFLYAGYKYMADKDKYGIKSEDIEPTQRNPDLEGALCKHIIAVFNKFDDFYDEIVSDIEAHAKKERKKK